MITWKAPITWSEKAKRYRDGRGRFISRTTMRAELERVREGYSARVRRLCEDLQSGRINTAAWVIDMKTELKSLHALNAAAARGGIKQMSPSDWGYVGQKTRAQYDYLQRFARQIQSGQQPLNGAFMRRAQMYVGASHFTFTEMEKRMMGNAGFKLAKRVLHAKESCFGCIAEASKDFRPIKEVAPIGSQQCLTNCRCEIIFETRAA